MGSLGEPGQMGPVGVLLMGILCSGVKRKGRGREEVSDTKPMKYSYLHLVASNRVVCNKYTGRLETDGNELQLFSVFLSPVPSVPLFLPTLIS